MELDVIIKLHKKLIESGLPVVGVCEDGRIDFEDTATEEQIALAESIVASFDPSPTYQELREAEYEKVGCTIQALVVALWEKVEENRPESANALQGKREEIKSKYPKPSIKI